MVRKVISGPVVLLTCLSLGSVTAFGDSWKDESGKGKGKGWGEYHKEWKEHRGETPDWARGKG